MSTDSVLKGRTRFELEERGEGAAMIAVEEANVSSNGRGAGGNNAFQDPGDGLQENNNVA